MMIYAQPHSSSPTLHSLLSTYINFLPEPEIDAWPLLALDKIMGGGG